MAEYSVRFYENGRETPCRVRYAGRPFGISLGADGLCRAFLELMPADSGNTYTFEATCRSTASGDEYYVSLPPVAPGLYYFRFQAVACGGGFETGTDRLLCVDNAYADITPPRGAIYHIFTDRFRRSGKSPRREDAYVHGTWGEDIVQYPLHPGDFVENNEFFGGDLFGVTEKLPYLKSLGIEWIYLSPVFTAYSNHKYDTGDFLTVDSMFGGEKALSELISACHGMGMKLILDGVFNHVGRDSVYFDYRGLGGGAYRNPDSPYREWFDIRADGSYDCWWGLTNLPKIRKTESYRRFICEKVIPRYMKMGIDGWRLDVVDEYDNAFLHEITCAAKSLNPDAVIIGEVWDDVVTKVAYSERKDYFCGEALDSAMNYLLREALITYFKTRDASVLARAAENQINYYPPEKLNLMMNILGTHDTERILTVLGDGVSGDRDGNELKRLRLGNAEREKAVKLQKAAYTLLACLPGIPTVFYGDEAGLEGYRDPFCRRPFPWGKEDLSLTAHYAAVNALRAAHPALSQGTARVLQHNDGFFVIGRYCGGEELVCICNMSGAYGYSVPECYTPLTGGSMTVCDGETAVYIRKK